MPRRQRRRSAIAELLELAEEIDRRITPIDRELDPIARADRRAKLLGRCRGSGPLLSLTFAAEIGEVSRFRSPGKLIGCACLAPRVSQSGERSATGALSKAGSRTLRRAAVEAAHQAWRPANPWHGHYLWVSARRWERHEHTDHRRTLTPLTTRRSSKRKRHSVARHCVGDVGVRWPYRD